MRLQERANLSRREFLYGTSALIAVSILSDDAAAWTHGSSGGSFNGGKSQVNLNFNQIGSDYPFANYMLDCVCWGARDNSGFVTPDQLTSTGYPIPGSDVMVNHAGVSGTLFVPSIVNGGSLYSIIVTGKGQVESSAGSVSSIAVTTITGGATTATINFGTTHLFQVGMECPLSGISGTIASTLNNNKYVVASVASTSITITVGSSTSGLSGTGGTAKYGDLVVGVATGGQVILDLTGTAPIGPGSSTGNALDVVLSIRATDATTPISGLAFVAISDRARWQADPYAFGTPFLSKLTAWKPGVIRFLNKLNTNISNVSVWADRKPLNFVSYAANQWPVSQWAGTSTSTLNAYSATLGSGAPTDKQHLCLKSDAAAVTCSVSGTAATLTFPSAHNLTVGKPFNLMYSKGGSAPTDLSTGLALAITGQGIATGANFTSFYVLTTPTANTLTFSLTKGGSPVTTSSAGSQLFAHAALAQNTFTSTNGSTTLSCTNHDFSVGMPIAPTAFQNNDVYPTGISPYGKTYFVKTATANTIEIAATLGGTAISMSVSQTIIYREQATISLNGTSAVPIKDTAALSMSFDGNTILYAYSPIGSPPDGSPFATTLTFDAELNVWLNDGGCVSNSTGGMVNGWPPEICLKLCKEVGAHPYFTSPPCVMDPPSDYLTQLPTLVKSYTAASAPWMIPRYEPPNELWNRGFRATILANAKALAHAGWVNGNFNDEYGLQLSVLGQAVHSVYGGAVGNGYKIMCGIQTGTAYGAVPTSGDQRMKSAQYIANGPAFSGYTQAAGSDYATSGVCAQYMIPPLLGSSTEATWASGVVLLTASINTSGVMNVTSGTPAVGMMVAGGSVPWQAIITANLGGGNWQLSVSPAAAVASNPVYAVAPVNVKSYVDSLAGNRFTATISGGVLNVSALGDSWTSINVGEVVIAAGVPANSAIGSQISGTTGGVGTYNFPSGITVGSPTAMVSGIFVPLELSQIYQNFWTWLQTFTNLAGNKPTMEGYEGGYSPDFASAGSSLTDQFRGFSKLITSTSLKTNGLQDYYTDNVDAFVNAHGTFWSEFQFTGNSSVTDAWSVKDDLFMSPAGPQEIAIGLRN